MIKAEQREDHVMVDLSVMDRALQSIESKRPQTMDMAVDNTGIATAVTAILPHICNQSTESFDGSSLLNLTVKSYKIFFMLYKLGGKK